MKNLHVSMNHPWLVVSNPLKNMKVNRDDELPNLWKNQSHVPVTTNQIPFTLHELYLMNLPACTSLHQLKHLLQRLHQLFGMSKMALNLARPDFRGEVGGIFSAISMISSRGFDGIIWKNHETLEGAHGKI